MLNLKIYRKPKLFRMSGKDSMTVLHISTPDSWRGGEQQLFYLMEELEQKGIQQYVFCRKNGELYQRAKDKSFNVIAYPKIKGLSLKAAYRIKELCESLNIQVIHTHDSKAHTLALLAGFLFRNASSIVVSRRVDFPIGKSFFSRFKYNYSKVSKIICVSDAIQEVMKPSIRDKNKLCTVHSGIDLSRFDGLSKGNELRTKFGISVNEFLIGNTSALAPHKDYFTWVDTAEILIKSNFPSKYVIMGDGPLMSEIQDYVRAKNLNEYIFFNGFEKNILPLLKELDLFLITSTTEGLGTSILDAFACKVPVVGTKAGGIPELVQHQKTGLLSPIKNATDLAENVQQILTNSELKNTLLSNAYSLLGEFSKSATAEKTLSIYREIGKR